LGFSCSGHCTLGVLAELRPVCCAPPFDAAELKGMPVAAFVREAALHEAKTTIAKPPKKQRSRLSSRLRGRATVRLSTDEIMQLTRGA